MRGVVAQQTLLRQCLSSNVSGMRRQLHSSSNSSSGRGSSNKITIIPIIVITTRITVVVVVVVAVVVVVVAVVVVVVTVGQALPPASTGLPANDRTSWVIEIGF